MGDPQPQGQPQMAMHAPDDPRPAVVAEAQEGTQAKIAVSVWLRLGVGSALAALLLYLLSNVVLLVFLATLLAASLDGVSCAVSRRLPVRRGIALAIIALCGLTLILGFGAWLGPQVLSQSHELSHSLGQMFQSLRTQYGQSGVGKQVFEHVQSGKDAGGVLSGPAKTLASSTLDVITGVFVLVVTALYFAISPKLYVTGLVRLVPQPHRPRLREVLLRIGGVLRRWMLGQAIDMATVAVLSTIGLMLVGVKLPLALGVLAGLLTFVPYFGAIAAAVPAVMIALPDGWHKALWVLVVFLLCHAVEGYVVSPLVQKRAVDLPPALTILSMTVMGTLFGPMGIIIGTPLGAVILVLVQDLYLHDVLHDPVEDAAGSRH